MGRMPVKQITISGFRAILDPLVLSFCGDGSSKPRCMCIYGSNGTGKSSVTDAWEWLQTGKIGHLRKEGAEEAAYPHIDAGDGQTYVEVKFSDPGLEKVRLEYNRSRITRPISSGPLEQLRGLTPHPCQLRFRDLTDFVYKKKAEKYDALALLMGFSQQVEVQKALRRVEREWVSRTDQKRAEQVDSEAELCDLLSIAQADADTVIASLNGVLARQCLGPAGSIDDTRRRRTHALGNSPGLGLC